MSDATAKEKESTDGTKKEMLTMQVPAQEGRSGDVQGVFQPQAVAADAGIDLHNPLPKESPVEELRYLGIDAKQTECGVEVEVPRVERK